MPFIIDSSQVHALGFAPPWDPIEIGLLAKYRKAFIDRHVRLKANGLDFKEDHDPQTVNAKFFHNLVNSAKAEPYLVAQYICDDRQGQYKNLRIALCIKRLKGRNADDTIEGEIYDLQGNSIDYEDFVELACNYARRKAIIANRGNSEFQWDKEGRAHKIDDHMKRLVKELCIDDQGRYKTVNAYFILDKFIDSRETLSVAFSSVGITPNPNPATISVGYDHGTACCPIG